ncbi:hypothetical protein A3D80_01305 [Candidatus Roizmanbacteria bacterium RIFCSPHIGHO2_02_FULL_40_13b]|nr:MAG: hypothetical protein A3D80_01305 [Candidatus Roizmanbacteria bacterium RIFCSPHIGHO2_02_FULL_40_13b]OGK49135.1 MAG: hypothetical protein A3A56_00830 [Candidatus Roizmanbacteria bacterium RIFCSPLOWO2_01_FULL_40_32]OGK57348.1 MAG: hypothetical protein A3H83_01040 [Candidatus Roizmanbacteria bacterium RIFCSPLOWO2_02_FULL_39_8]
MKRDAYIKHILNAIIAIEEFTHNVSYEDFVTNNEKQSAVIRQFEIIGEAVNQLEKAFQEENKSLRDIHIPIEEIVEMRNILIHEYFGVDLELVWDTLKEDLPNLKTQLKNVTD